jgi:hypothetical protein
MNAATFTTRLARSHRRDAPFDDGCVCGARLEGVRLHDDDHPPRVLLIEDEAGSLRTCLIFSPKRGCQVTARYRAAKG